MSVEDDDDRYDFIDDRWENTVYHTGDIVTRQGESAGHLYVLNRGRLAVVFTPGVDNPEPEDVTLKHQVAALEEAGVIFGEQGLFQERRGASIVCLSETAEVSSLDIPDSGWEEMLMRHPAVAVKLCTILAKRVKATANKLRHAAAFADVVERAVRHYAAEFSRLVEATDTALKQRAFCELDEELGRLSEGLEALRHRPLYRRGTDVITARKKAGSGASGDEGPDTSGLIIELAADETFFGEGEVGNSLYLVLDGDLEVEVGGKAVGNIAPDQFLGMVAFLSGEAGRSGQVRATEPTRLARVADTLGEFWRIGLQQPTIPVSLVRDLSGLVDSNNQMMTKRLVELKSEVENLGVGGDAADALFLNLGALLSIHATTEELARRAGECAARVQHMRTSLMRELQNEVAASTM